MSETLNLTETAFMITESQLKKLVSDAEEAGYRQGVLDVTRKHKEFILENSFSNN